MLMYLLLSVCLAGPVRAQVSASPERAAALKARIAELELRVRLEPDPDKKADIEEQIALVAATLAYEHMSRLRFPEMSKDFPELLEKARQDGQSLKPSGGVVLVSAGVAIPNTQVRKTDGTVKILRPSVEGRWVSSNSDLDGLCKRYRYNYNEHRLQQAISAEAAPLSVAASPILIGKDGQVSGHDRSSGGYLKSVTCR